MAFSPSHSCLYDVEAQMPITSSLTNKNQLVENDAADIDDDEGLEEIMKGLRAVLAALQDEDDVLTPEWWDWTVGVEADTRQAAEEMAKDEEATWWVLSSVRSRDEAAALLAHAARCGALRAGAEKVAAAARRLRKTDLRRLTAAEFSYVTFLTRKQLAMGVLRRTEAAAVRLEEYWMASLAARLTRGAAEFAATPGEETFVAAMRREAAKAEDVRSMLAWYRAAAGGGRGGGSVVVQPGQVAQAKLMIHLALLAIIFLFCSLVTRTSFS